MYYKIFFKNMKKVYLILALILVVIMLIISFSNWNNVPLMIFFTYTSFSLTLGFMMIGALGILAGFLFGLYVKTPESEKNNDEEEDFDDF